jgi:hypothetical protein
MLIEKENSDMVARRRKKNPHAVAMGKLAGAARTKALSPERRKEIAKIAAAARWTKYYRANPKEAPQ